MGNTSTVNLPETNSIPRSMRRLLIAAMCGVFVVVWLVDLDSTKGLQVPAHNLLPPLLSGPVAAVFLLLPDRWLALERRGWVAACCSLVITGGMALAGWDSEGSWGMLETICLLIMVVRTCREVRRPFVAALLAAAVVTAPVRLFNPDSVSDALVLTYFVAGAVGLGCYLRVRDVRRTRLVESVRRGQRLELARDLHDFVAHHVTGIVVQANAAQAIHETAPEQVDPILEDIRKAGMETLESMRRLVRVLREVEDTPQRPGELFTELAMLVSDFCGAGDQEATLSVASPARAARLAPEVETSVHRLVQESLTNARRHAPGALVAVRVELEDGRLRTEVRNTPALVRQAVPVGGSSGLGMVGLRERVAAVGGTLDAGARPEGGWLVSATFPVLTVARSAS